MVEVIAIKQLCFNDKIVKQGDTVKIILNGNIKKFKNFPHEYTGYLSDISDKYCTVRENCMPIPVFYDDIESIEVVELERTGEQKRKMELRNSFITLRKAWYDHVYKMETAAIDEFDYDTFPFEHSFDEVDVPSWCDVP